MKEVEVNLQAGQKRAWLHSDGIFNYMVEDRRNFHPNENVAIELFERVELADPMHGTVAGALAAPRILKGVSELNCVGMDRWIGIQVGSETASPELVKKLANSKMKPFSAEEWPWVLRNGTYTFSEFFWLPAYATTIGLPWETGEDGIETAKLIVTMEKKLKKEFGKRAHFIIILLAFVPWLVQRELGKEGSSILKRGSRMGGFSSSIMLGATLLERWIMV